MLPCPLFIVSQLLNHVHEIHEVCLNYLIMYCTCLGDIHVHCVASGNRLLGDHVISCPWVYFRRESPLLLGHVTVM